MKKMIAVIMICLFCACTVAGCRTTEKETTTREVPELQLEYTVGGKTQTVDAYVIFCFWADTVYDMARLPDTLDLANGGVLPEIENDGSISELKITFTSAPDSFSVWRWEDMFIGDLSAYKEFYNNEQDYETVSISDNIIDISDDNMGYVYEVRASWEQCVVYYAFYVKIK